MTSLLIQPDSLLPQGHLVMFQRSSPGKSNQTRARSVTAHVLHFVFSLASDANAVRNYCSNIGFVHQGTHYGCMECKICPTVSHMTSTGNPQTFWSWSWVQCPYPLGHMLKYCPYVVPLGLSWSTGQIVDLNWLLFSHNHCENLP